MSNGRGLTVCLQDSRFSVIFFQALVWYGCLITLTFSMYFHTLTYGGKMFVWGIDVWGCKNMCLKILTSYFHHFFHEYTFCWFNEWYCAYAYLHQNIDDFFLIEYKINSLILIDFVKTRFSMHSKYFS